MRRCCNRAIGRLQCMAMKPVFSYRAWQRLRVKQGSTYFCIKSAWSFSVRDGGNHVLAEELTKQLQNYWELHADYDSTAGCTTMRFFYPTRLQNTKLNGSNSSSEKTKDFVAILYSVGKEQEYLAVYPPTAEVLTFPPHPLATYEKMDDHDETNFMLVAASGPESKEEKVIAPIVPPSWLAGHAETPNQQQVIVFILQFYGLGFPPGWQQYRLKLET